MPRVLVVTGYAAAIATVVVLDLSGLIPGSLAAAATAAAIAALGSAMSGKHTSRGRARRAGDRHPGRD